MNKKEKIILQLYFPNFKSPASSRFESLFVNINKTNGKPNKNTSYLIFPERIIRGEDKRTSILIKNIPKNIKKKEIRNLVEQYANINFLGITHDKKSKSLIVAYLNVINYKTVVPIFMGLRKNTFNYHNEKIFTELYYSKFQGKEELKKVFHK